MKPAWIVAFGVLTFTALFGACSGGDETPSAPATPTPTAQEALQRSADAIAELQTFHFLITHENGGSSIALGLVMNEAEGHIAAPDKMSASVKASAGGLNVDVDVINIGNEVWITNPFNGQWQSLPTGIRGNDLFNPGTGVAAAFRAATNPTITGGETIDGESTYLIEATVDSGELAAFAPIAEPGIPVKVKAWVRTSDYTPLRLRLEGPLAAEEPANLARQVDLSHFDEPVDIEPPPVS